MPVHRSQILLAGDSLNATEAAAMLGAHVETVRRLARRGELPAFKVGKDWRFSERALREWMVQQPAVANKREAERVPLALVVDDEPMLCRAIVRALERDGYRARFALDGASALELVAQEPPDLVLLDLAMPLMTGPEFLERLRVSSPDLPVVIVTGFPDSELMHRALQFPPLLLLPKPVDSAQLLQTVRGALGAARAMSHAG